MKTHQMDKPANRNNILKYIIGKTNRVPMVFPRNTGECLISSPSFALARVLDIALLDLKCKMSSELFDYLSKGNENDVRELIHVIFTVCKERLGAHVPHNTYFINFPNNIPDTWTFWMELINNAVKEGSIISNFHVNLLDIPQYGKYLHSYQDMMDVHEKFLPLFPPTYTILNLGDNFREEVRKLYFSLASSPIPLHEEEREMLTLVANRYRGKLQPSVPIRENRALINRVRLERRLSLLIDRPLDILRIFGDETLEKKIPFGKFSRPQRRIIMAAINDAIISSPKNYEDMKNHFGEWKRLGERIHPHEYSQYPNAQDFFTTVRSGKCPYGIRRTVEKCFQEGNIILALDTLCLNPGLLLRNLERLLLSSQNLLYHQRSTFLHKFSNCFPQILSKIPSRLLFSLWEHFMNTARKNKRIFINRKGKAWVTPETRAIISSTYQSLVTTYIKEEIKKRIIANPIQCNIQSYAVPLSNKTMGTGMLPRGSTFPISMGILRFFVYWKEKEKRTDWDLSCLFLDKNFEPMDQCSWTALSETYFCHSGDIIQASDGASEFINIDLSKLPRDIYYIIPQINVYHGEGFNEVEEGFMGFMNLDSMEKGLPYEPLAVESKFPLHGESRVVLPCIFDRFFAKSTNIYLKGSFSGNRVERNALSTSLLLSTIYNRKYLTIGDILSLQSKVDMDLPTLTLEKPEDVYLTMPEL